MQLCVIRPCDKYVTGDRITEKEEAERLLGLHPHFVVRIAEETESATLPPASPAAAIAAVTAKKAKDISTADDSGEQITD